MQFVVPPLTPGVTAYFGQLAPYLGRLGQAIAKRQIVLVDRAPAIDAPPRSLLTTSHRATLASIVLDLEQCGFELEALARLYIPAAAPRDRAKVWGFEIGARITGLLEALLRDSDDELAFDEPPNADLQAELAKLRAENDSVSRRMVDLEVDVAYLQEDRDRAASGWEDAAAEVFRQVVELENRDAELALMRDRVRELEGRALRLELVDRVQADRLQAPTAAELDAKCIYCGCSFVDPCELPTSSLSEVERATIRPMIVKAGEPMPATVPCRWLRSPKVSDQPVCSNPECAKQMLKNGAPISWTTIAGGSTE